MKKLLILLVSLIFFIFSGCSNMVKDNSNDKNEIGNIVEKPSEILPLPPTVEDEEDEDKKKKTYIISNASSLRIRSGAGSNYSVLGSIQKNDLLSYQGIKGSYYITVYKEKKAYIHKEYCSLIEFDVESDEIEKAIEFGSNLLGYPYVWGSQRYHWGNGVLNKNFVNGEFDCSALVQYIYYKTNGVLLDVTSRAQSVKGELIKKSDLQRGDLMFFTNASRKDKVGIEKVGHVGIYFGNNYILHTASDYAVIEPISSTRWSYYLHARRVV